MEKRLLDFIQFNSPDGGFLQSEDWRKFQEASGTNNYTISESSDNGEFIYHANIIEHKLPIVGSYFYIPRGPVFENFKFQILNFKSSPNDKIIKFLNDLIILAEKNNIGWIRIEPSSEEELELIGNNLPKNIKIKKSAVDMQPRDILILDIAKSEDEILAGMKQKTRYNVKLSQKRDVSVKVISNFQFPISKRYIGEFFRLLKITTKRDKITSHPENYYRKMFETIPGDILKLYIAEYNGNIIAANLVLFFGKTATYMHGASDNDHRSVMAPYILQWQAIRDAKKAGCTQYDLGGVGGGTVDNSWTGITKFKTGFAPDAQPVQFPGCYDIILKPAKYNFYRTLQRIKRIF